jgi:hypothetical protein
MGQWATIPLPAVRPGRLTSFKQMFYTYVSR